MKGLRFSSLHSPAKYLTSLTFRPTNPDTSNSDLILTKYSLVSINIETGRKNQIRVAFASLGNAILGDTKYGIKDDFNRLYLHANRLKMYYPVIKKDILFETSNPVEFRKIMDK